MGSLRTRLPVAANMALQCSEVPGVAGQLDLYKANLGDLQTTLEQIRIMLLVRQASLEAGRSPLCAISQWVTALRQTRSP